MPDPDPQRLQVEVVARPGEVATRGLASWLRRIAPARARGRVIVAMVSDPAMRTMNRRYRGADRVTDVLSFGAAAPASSAATSRSSTERRTGGWRDLAEAPGRGGSAPGPHLGDIAIARGVATRQARASGHSLGTEVRILALHGLLHLLGYDHEHDGGAMARVETRLRRRGGLPDGLIARSRVGRGTGRR